MAHIISEAPTFDLDIVVPDPLDDMSDAAEVVTGFTQKLANRTQYLANAIGAGDAGSAKLGLNNVFTGSLNTFQAVTVNGNLNVKDNAVIGTDGTGTLTVKSLLQAEANLTVFGVVTFPGGAQIQNPIGNTDLRVIGAVSSPNGKFDTAVTVPKDGVNYSGAASARLQSLNIPLVPRICDPAQITYLHIDSGRITITSPCEFDLILPKLPSGAVLQSYQVQYDKGGAAVASRVRLDKGTCSFATTGATYSHTPDAEVTLSLAAGIKTITITAPSTPINNVNDTLWIHVFAFDGYQFSGASVTFADPGPRSG